MAAGISGVTLTLACGLLCACASPLRGALDTPARYPDGSHHHAFAAALREAQPTARSLGRVATAPGTYVVKKGDTLYSLARAHGVSVQTLASLNGLARPQELQAGTRLRLPGTPAAASQPSATLADTSPKLTGPRAATVSPVAPFTMRWPVSGSITSRFGHRSGRAHDGIDIGAAPGTEVRAAADGDVVFADAHGGYGNVVILRHPNGLLTVYAHHERNLVRRGQRVHAGDAIAKVGTTGRSSGPHLHFEVRRGIHPTNPLGFLPP